MTVMVEDLLQFVSDALAYGWPDHTTLRVDDEFPDFYNTAYSRGPWRYVDLWSGSSTDAGAQFVFRSEKAVWSCVYRGGLVNEGDTHDLTLDGNPVFKLLVEALRLERHPLLPIRGPALYERDGLKYMFSPTGNMRSFLAVETITDQHVVRYERIFVGGLFGDGVTYGNPLLSEHT